jgi:methanogenic corrinoid protein MtbC1
MKQLYEATTEEKQLAAIGREMMDFSENASMAKLKNEEIRPYNDLSDVGYMLTQIGALFGTNKASFTAHQTKVMEDWQKYKGSNLVKGGPCLRTTF